MSIRSTSNRSSQGSISRNRSTSLPEDEAEARVLSFLQYSGVPYTQWQDLFDSEDADEVCYLVLQEILDLTMDKLYKRYMEMQTIPFSVRCIRKAWEKLFEMSTLVRDPGRMTETWDVDDPPEQLPLDNWAANSLANVVFERQPSEQENQTEVPATPRENAAEETPQPETQVSDAVSGGGYPAPVAKVPPPGVSGHPAKSTSRAATASTTSEVRRKSATDAASVGSSHSTRFETSTGRLRNLLGYGRIVSLYMPPKMFTNNLILVQSRVQGIPYSNEAGRKKSTDVTVDSPEPSILDLASDK